MTYLVADDLPTAPAGDRFRALLARPGIVQLPGTHNGQAALQAKAAGFEGLYLSGAAMTASMGLPDLGIITVDEVCFFIRQVARSTGLPVLVDGDTGYGEALNVMNMVRSFEDAGAGAVHIEDQLLPKKCGHLNDKKLADAHDMAAKIAAARKARKHLYIIARTDAAASEGMDGAGAVIPPRAPTAACTWLARLRKPAMAFCLACSESAVALKRSSAETSAPFNSSYDIWRSATRFSYAACICW